MNRGVIYAVLAALSFSLQNATVKELIPKGAILPLAVIVCGASLVVRPWHFDAFNVYSLFVLAQAVLAAAAYTTVSRLTASGKHHQYEIVLYFLICAAIAGAVLMGRDFRMPDMTEWGFCIALGIFSVLGQIWITRSYMYGNAVVVSFVAYIAVFFNSLWGYVFYGEIMTAMTLTGGVLIIGGSMYLTKLKHDRISARNKAGA